MAHSSELHSALRHVVFDLGRRRSDVGIICLPISQTKLVADFRVPVQHELAGLISARTLPLCAKQRNPSTLVRSAGTPPRPPLARPGTGARASSEIQIIWS